MAEALKGIQASLLDYFKDAEYFTPADAYELVLKQQQRDVNTESIRARIYEGIDKGLFERVGKGLYTVTRQNEQGSDVTCMVINGNGTERSRKKGRKREGMPSYCGPLFRLFAPC